MVRTYLVLHEGTKETKYINLPGSDLFVSSEGTLYSYSERVPKKNRKGYYVLRQGTKKYYTVESLKQLYAKLDDKV
jgi:hypothetical protein